MDDDSSVIEGLDQRRDFDLLNVREAAVCLRISRDLVYELVARGELPSIRLGRQIRLPVFGLRQWIIEQSGAASPASPGVVSLPPRQQH